MPPLAHQSSQQVADAVVLLDHVAPQTPSERSAARYCRRSMPSSGGRWAGFVLGASHAGRGSPATLHDSGFSSAGCQYSSCAAAAGRLHNMAANAARAYSSFHFRTVYRARESFDLAAVQRACVMVSSSTYSSSSPKPMPRAMEVIFSPGTASGGSSGRRASSRPRPRSRWRGSPPSRRRGRCVRSAGRSSDPRAKCPASAK